jgi:hypothetical protein
LQQQHNAPTVSVTQLNDKNTQPEISRGKRGVIVPVIESVGGDDENIRPQIQNEVDLLTEDDWIFVAQIVQVIERVYINIIIT